MVWNKTHTRGTDWASCPGEVLRRKWLWSGGKGARGDWGKKAFKLREEEGARKGEDAEGKARVSDADSSQGLE